MGQAELAFLTLKNSIHSDDFLDFHSYPAAADPVTLPHGSSAFPTAYSVHMFSSLIYFNVYQKPTH